MIINVIKKDGSRASFNEEKIRRSVRMAAERAGLSEEKMVAVVYKTASEVAKLTEGKEEVSTTELRETILGVLNNMEPSVVQSWEEYESAKKHSLET
ncbi:MAG: ATP cone domain-containing protein [Candidatus Liptonbacteria bacterium]|nr:ATP cone domain-containing protein [Candidatus Liptonbacteria bacterium]